MELHGYVGIQRVWAWAQVVPMDNLVDGQRVGRWVMGWIWTSSTRPKPDPLPSLPLHRHGGHVLEGKPSFHLGGGQGRRRRRGAVSPSLPVAPECRWGKDRDGDLHQQSCYRQH